MRRLTQQEVDIVCFINYEGVVATSSIAYNSGLTSKDARSKLKILASIGAIKRHVFSCANCIKWIIRRN